jgi:hypothetical protein
MRFSILGEGSTGRWFLEVRRLPHASKIECGGEGARHSSRPRKHGVEDRHNQDRGDDKRGEGHHSSSPSASNLPVLTCFNAAMNVLCIAVGWRGDAAGPENLAILVTVGSMRSAHEPGSAP